MTKVSPSAAEAPPDRPHVLLITVDQWPGRLLGCAGHPVVQTPTLDALARSGVRYTRAYSECPVCIPARRSLLTGQSPRLHGDRVYRSQLPLPAGVMTLPEAFAAAGYQTGLVGKMHIHPPRARAGFHEAVIMEEGRCLDGVLDDYDLFLGDRGYPGQNYAHALPNNGYESRAWHLPEDLHPTNWITAGMVRMIRRRDPTRPGFWHLSYNHPHPPLAPLAAYLDLYRDLEPEEPARGEWNFDERLISPAVARAARRAFYALCTHIDHQLRLVVAALRHERILEQTAIVFSSDHGELLGDHGWWGKRAMVEGSAAVPLIVCPSKPDTRTTAGTTDDRLVAWRDLMPTLLDLAGLPVPASVEGWSALSGERRTHLYGECSEGATATRMITDGRFKLVYWASGNRWALFDLKADPRETHDLSNQPAQADRLAELQARLASELYGGDEQWVVDGKWVGLPTRTDANGAFSLRLLDTQRSLLWPPVRG
jgi:arylsulfatase